jgi:hypothetical protein
VGGANENSVKVRNASKGARLVSRTEDGAATTAQLPETAVEAGAAAQTIKYSIANTTERTGTNTGRISINQGRYTYIYFFWMIIRSWSSEALGNGYFMIGDISLTGLAALCVTGGFFANLGQIPILWLRYCLMEVACIHAHVRACR